MAITAKDVEQLHDYVEGVMVRAGHHAAKVKGTVLTILGGIVWRADPNTIRMRRYAGAPANMLWVTVNGKDYAFRYEHTTGQIEIRHGKQNGAMLQAVDDKMVVADIQAIMAGL